MARLPFNPDLLPDIDPGPPARREQAQYGSFDGGRPLTVSQVTELVKRVLADRAPSPLSIVGEVSNFSDREHWYLSLKDEQSVIACVMWASAAKKCGFVPQRGQQVVARGRLDYYGPQGKLQFYIEKIEPVGQGALELRFRQLCDELRTLGYFDEDRKRPMPVFPEHIAVVTSGGGAALQDVIKTARQRWPGVSLSLFDVRVQGEGAADEVAAAIRFIGENFERFGIQAVIVTRGGGSLEDLWAFNERVVADAIFHCRLPVVAAIGHETDTTIAELVADLRCSTPTQAAARLVPDAQAERQRLDSMTSRLSHALRRGAEWARARFESLAQRDVFRKPFEALAAWRKRLEHDGLRLNVALRTRFEAPRRRLDTLQLALARIEPGARLASLRQRLETQQKLLAASVERMHRQHVLRLDAKEMQLRSVGPQRVLARGYSYTTDASGNLVQSVHDTHRGQLIRTHLRDGSVDSRVESGPSPAPRRKPTARVAHSPGAGAPGLFDVTP